jgi:molybdopterin/thiamine biosynthesis adenylyltransferase
MPEWGEQLQEKLLKSRVVVIGAGGVKSVLLMNLAALGVGEICIIDGDIIEDTNLNRQLLYTEQDVGKHKAEVARIRLQKINSSIRIASIIEYVDETNISELCSGYDLIIEGGDSPYARNLVNLFSLRNNIPMLHVSAQFNYGYLFMVLPSQRSACFACFFPEDHTRKESTGAVPVSVLATSTAGSLGSAEVVKFLSGNHDTLYINKRLCFSSLLLSGEFTVLNTARNPKCTSCSGIYNC